MKTINWKTTNQLINLCPESPNIEKLDEMPDYETMNGVSRSNCISATILIKNPSGQLLK